MSDSSQEVRLTPHMTLRQGSLNATAHVGNPGVLGEDEVASTLPFNEFMPADRSVELDMPDDAPAPGVLGADESPTGEGELVFRPAPGETSADFAYALVHEVQTPDGVAYDITLPLAPAVGVLGTDDEIGVLRFPVNSFVRGSDPNTNGAEREPRPGVLGLDAALANTVGKIVFKHVLTVVKAPIENAIKTTIAKHEGDPVAQVVVRDGTLTPLVGAESWRALFSDPTKEQRVLLFLHGFLSSAEQSLPRAWLPALHSHYDAVLAYTHPTLTLDPLQNATDWMSQIPEELRLKVDLVAHSRGGLVARSLVELAPHTPKVDVRRLLTCGTPHAGTSIAQREKWDRLISMGLTATNWLLSTSGVGIAYTMIPGLLEQLLKAGSQFFFDLPGVNAMVPGSEFLAKLNAINTAPMSEGFYDAVASNFAISTVRQMSFRDALYSLAVQAFINESHDLIVPTASMTSIDSGSAPFAGSVFTTNVNHFGYFDAPDVLAFAREKLGMKS